MSTAQIRQLLAETPAHLRTELIAVLAIAAGRPKAQRYVPAERV